MATPFFDELNAEPIVAMPVSVPGTMLMPAIPLNSRHVLVLVEDTIIAIGAVQGGTAFVRSVAFDGTESPPWAPWLTTSSPSHPRRCAR